jgi:hypothetical protein
MDTVNIGDQFFTGEDKSLRFTIYADTAHAAAQNITGWALSWMVKRRKTHADASAVVTKTTAGGGIVMTTPASGICTVTLDDADIVDISGGQLYYHELKRTDSGAETVLAQGTFILNQAVHR